MKKTIMTMMAAAMIATTGTALAATPGAVDCRDNAPCVEANYTCCGGGYYGGGRGGRGGYGCDGDERGHRGGYVGYCWGNEDN